VCPGSDLGCCQGDWRAAGCCRDAALKRRHPSALSHLLLAARI
jgi:hypothetical protein